MHFNGSHSIPSIWFNWGLNKVCPIDHVLRDGRHFTLDVHTIRGTNVVPCCRSLPPKEEYGKYTLIVCHWKTPFTTVNDASCSEIIIQNRYMNNHDIANGLNIHHQLCLNLLKQIGSKKEVHSSHESAVKNLIDRINIYDSLKKQNEIELFLKWNQRQSVESKLDYSFQLLQIVL